MKMGASCVGAPISCCFFFCTHTILSLSFSLTLALSLKVTPTRFPPTRGHPTPAGSSAFLFCALGLASCCVLLCRVRDLCHTECKYMSKHAKHFTDHDMNRHTYAQFHYLCSIYIHISTQPLCVCVCANGKLGDCL